MWVGSVRFVAGYHTGNAAWEWHPLGWDTSGADGWSWAWDGNSRRARVVGTLGQRYRFRMRGVGGWHAATLRQWDGHLIAGNAVAYTLSCGELRTLYMRSGEVDESTSGRRFLLLD